MQDGETKPGKVELPRGLKAAAERRARQAAALRDNLARRKTQGRLRSALGEAGDAIAAAETLPKPGHG